MSITIALKLRFLSPAFLGGAGQAAELRPPSIKGMLRFWMRAVDPGFREREMELFGGAGTGAGQSRVLLRAQADSPLKCARWDRQRAQSRFTKGQRTHSTNGLVYLGYPFQLPGNEDRTALEAGTKFDLRCVLPRGLRKGHEERDRRALLASLWAFGMLGALGMRSRRGFGSLALDSWEVEGHVADERHTGGWLKDMASLPLAFKVKDAAVWRERYNSGLKTIRTWLGEFRATEQRPLNHPHIGPNASYRLSPESVRDLKDWQRAVEHAGLQLQTFRQRMGPDYANMKEHLRSGGQGAARIKVAPERAAFGLPLTFRYSSLPHGTRPAVFVPVGRAANQKPYERHPSPLLLKLVELEDGLHSLWIRLDGPRPGTEPRATERNGQNALGAPTRDLVGEFLADPNARMER